MKQIINLCILLGCILFNFSASAQDELSNLNLDYYLPPTDYNEDIPSPKDFLGYEIGEWHVNHDKLIAYMHLLAEKSDRVNVTEYGRTYEKRPLIYLTITSPENQSRLPEIKKQQQALADPSYQEAINYDELPAVLYQGYSIHGDESSGSNAAMAVAYYLAAGQSAQVLDILDKLVVLFDPCYNPDGLQRYTAWVNANQDQMLNADPNDISHNEPWPTGRTNHYWFDLNRDWLLLTHPESRGRIKTFQDWNPNVLTDHHEMGSNGTFFFQPGVPSRTNPLTPQINQDLTEDIGRYHAAALDSLGADYFTKERFDDFYYGKGSTYPDGQGCIGILFEQATSEGIAREVDTGILTLAYGIRNQVNTSLSTYKAMLDMKEELLSYQYDFFRERAEDAKQDKVKAYVVHAKDAWKRYRFANILEQHKIQYWSLEEDAEIKSKKFPAKESFVVKTDQKQYTLIKSIFSTQTEFTDSIFYDVSTWTFPFAFNTDYSFVGEKELGSLNLSTMDMAQKRYRPQTKKMATLVIPWDNYMAPSIFYKLIKQGIECKRSDEVFNLNGQDIIDGSIFIETDGYTLEEYNSLINQCRNNLIEPILLNQSLSQIEALGFKTSLYKGDFQVALLTGGRVNSYEAGDTWFQLDHRWDIPTTRIDVSTLNDLDLSRYDCIIMPDGRYDWAESTMENIEDWISDGGNFVVMRRAIQYLNEEGWFGLTEQAEKNNARKKKGGGQVIGGSIFQTEADLNDPLFYGYADKYIPVFKKGTQWYEPIQNANISTISAYSAEARLSGYSSPENLYKASNSAAVMKMQRGLGSIILLVDNPNFRGYWFGGSTLFANSIFYQN